MVRKTDPRYLSLSRKSIPKSVLAFFSNSPENPFHRDWTREREHPARNRKDRPLNRIRFLESQFFPNFEKACFDPCGLFISKIRIVKDPSLANFEWETLIVTVQSTPQHAGYDPDARTSWELVFFPYQILLRDLQSMDDSLKERLCTRILFNLVLIRAESGNDILWMVDLLKEDDKDHVKISQQPSIAEVRFNTPPCVLNYLDFEGRLAQAEEFEFQPTHTTAATASLSQDDTTRPPLYFMSFLLLLESLILLPGEATHGFHGSSGWFWLIMKLFDTVASVFGIPQTIRVNDHSRSSKLLTPLFNIGLLWLIMNLFDTLASVFGIPQIIRVNDPPCSSNLLTPLFNISSLWLIMKLFAAFALVFGIPQTINDRSWFSNLLTWLFNMFRRPSTASDPRLPGTIGPVEVMKRPGQEKICEYVKIWAEANAEFKERDEFTMYKRSLQAKIEETEGSESEQECTSEEECTSEDEYTSEEVFRKFIQSL